MSDNTRGDGDDEVDRPGSEPRRPPDDPGQPGPGQPGMGQPDLGALFGQLQQMFSWRGGPVNWDLALDVARQTIRAAGDASLTPGERQQVEGVVELAEHWLDEATALPSGAVGAYGWNRGEWLEGTLPVWKQLIEPVATHVVEAMGRALPEQARQVGGPLVGMLSQAGGAMFGAQIGQALGQLATEVLGATDIGLPLGPKGRAVLLPANIAAFGEGLGVPADDVRLYLALRECAHQRLFAHAPWLSSRLVAAVEEYAAGMHVDVSRLEEALGGLDLSRPEALQDALTGGLFEPQETPRQQAALARLETLLALIEGWVDDVVSQATARRMPSAVALHEAVRRRRAVGGPAEQTFATLVGLELRPRRLRDAATLWAALRESGGPVAREAPWGHPDLLPSSDDLDDPVGFAGRQDTSDLDLAALTGESGDGGSEDRGEDAGPAGRDGPGGPGDPPR